MIKLNQKLVLRKKQFKDKIWTAWPKTIHSDRNMKANITIHKFSSVAQSSPNPCNHVDWSTSGFLICHQLLELARTHIHWVGDAIQPSHPLLSLSPPVLPFPASGSFPMSQFFHQVAKVLKLQLQPQSFQWIFRTAFL